MVSTSTDTPAKGEILVAIDLVTREVCLWLLPNRKHESVSRALLSGLVFVKGVPLEFRSDNAPELMSGLVSAMNHNCTYSSVIECTPFEAGHGLRARTVAEARMAIPKLQLLEEEADDSPIAQAWDMVLRP